jgi:hypothetical protein
MLQDRGRDKKEGAPAVLKKTVRAAKFVVEAGGSLIGFRRFTEEPAHTTAQLGDGVEIRRYQSRMAAETVVVSDEEAARRIGFGRLAGYIFGANHVASATPGRPVIVEHVRPGAGEKIAMTAPVTQLGRPDGQWIIRFYMPADKSLASLPQPDDPAVSLVTLPAETLAVRRFSGGIGPQAVAAQTAALMRTLSDRGIEAIDSPAAWFYDPPWTIPFLRRNEIVVPVRPVD